jgi:Uma2 family endonuclease
MTVSLVKQQSTIGKEDYLAGERISQIKHELIEGQAYAMAGASRNHDRITKNIARKFGNHLEDSPCEVYGQDMLIEAGSNMYYPDVFVDCHVDESSTHYSTTPVIIVEVLSKSTHQTDRTTKRLSYMNIPTLLEYVLIEQDFVEVQVMRKSDDWKSTYYVLGDSVHFGSIDLTLSIEAIYQRVHNDNMIAFLQKTQQNK